MSDTEPVRTHWTWYFLAISVVFFAAVALYKTTDSPYDDLPPHFLNAPCSLSHGQYVTCTVNNEVKVTGPSIFDVKLITGVEPLPGNRPSVSIQECEHDLTDCTTAYVHTKSNIEAVGLTKQIEQWQKEYGRN